MESRRDPLPDAYPLSWPAGWPRSKEVNNAFKRMALKAHPDHGGSDAAFQRIVQARTDALRSR